MIVSLPRSPWFYRCLNGVLALLLAWVAAGIVWQLVAPAPKPPAAAPVMARSAGASLDMAPLANLFGPQQGGAAAPSSLNYKLRGVIAAQGDASAVAMFEIAGQPTVAVRTNDEIEPGVRLVEVAADHALVDNRGRRERIELDAKPPIQGILPASEAPPAADTKLIAPAPPPAPPLPPTQGMTPPVPTQGAASGNERMVDSGKIRPLLAGNHGSWMHGLSNNKGGGIYVINASVQPLGDVLGLQNGDVLTAFNGSPLSVKNDVAQVYSLLARVPNAKLDIVRSGTPLTLYYRIETQAKS